MSVSELAALVAGERDYALDAARKAPLLTVDVGGPLCVDAALAALDWSPTPIRSAVRETVAWYETAEHRNYTRALAAGKTPAALEEPEPKRRRQEAILSQGRVAPTLSPLPKRTPSSSR